MKLVTYRPMGLDLFDWDRVLDRFFDETFLTWNFPSVDVREEEGRYILEAELPGLTEKDFELKLEDGHLILSSRKEDAKSEKKNGYLWKERRHASFRRSFLLPEDVDREKVSAEFKNGLLNVVLEKVPKAQPKQIDVRTN